MADDSVLHSDLQGQVVFSGRMCCSCLYVRKAWVKRKGKPVELYMCQKTKIAVSPSLSGCFFFTVKCPS